MEAFLCPSVDYVIHFSFWVKTEAKTKFKKNMIDVIFLNKNFIRKT